jgi:hypothetical protein
MLAPEDALQPPADNEADSVTNTEEDSAQGRAETSWERLNAERQAESDASPSEEPPNTFNPLILWRMLRSALWKDH